MQKVLHSGEIHPKRRNLLDAINKNRKFVVEIISALCILLFVYTGVDKFMALETLKFVLKNYPIVGIAPNLIAWGLPITELVVSLLLFIPRTRLLGLYCFLTMMTGFSMYVAYMLLFSPKLPCTCGGLLYMLSWPQHLMFNIFFALIAAFGIRVLRSEAMQKKSI